MSLIERITRMDQVKAWYGDIPIESRYTLGLAGERFFRALKDKGVIMGAVCPQCELTYLPPAIYCERCFSPLEEWVEVGKQGWVHTFAILNVDPDGSPLEEPEILALIKMEGVHGGLVHRLGEVEPQEVDFGLPVEAVLKPKKEREGSILDIRYFRPLKG